VALAGPNVSRSAMDLPTFLTPKVRNPTPVADAILVLGGIQSAIEALQASVAKLEPLGSGLGERAPDPRIEAMEMKLRDLTTALSDGVQRVQRSENRVRHIVAGARKELRDAGFEHAGVEAESGELREIDGSERPTDELPEVPTGVAEAQHSVIPGVTVRQLQIARARRR